MNNPDTKKPARKSAARKKTSTLKEKRTAFEKFCAAIARGMKYREALKDAKITHGFVWARRKEKKLDDLFKDAIAQRAELWRAECDERVHELAVEGQERLVVSGGRLLGRQRDYNASLLQYLHKCGHPELNVSRVQADVTHRESLDDLLAALEAQTPIGQETPVPQPETNPKK